MHWRAKELSETLPDADWLPELDARTVYDRGVGGSLPRTRVHAHFALTVASPGALIRWEKPVHLAPGRIS